MSRPTRGPIVGRSGAVAAALVLLLGAWLAPRAFADPADEQPAAEPRFPVERITVEGARYASAELIVSESLLAEGHSYSEEDLRDAIYRIKRLPFLIDARFALRKGSERGRYELVITVDEISPVFFGLDLDNALAYTSFGGTSWHGQGKGTIGARWFAGRHGVLFGAVEGDEAQVGYTHYDLFGRRVFATFVYGRTSKDFDGLRFEWDAGDLRAESLIVRNADSERFTLLTGFPLSTHQTLRFRASSTEVDRDEFVRLRERSTGRNRGADVQWIYDSTDDPVLPTRGRLANVGLVGNRSSERGVGLGSVGPAPGGPLEPVRFSQEAENVALVAGLRQYRPLSSRQSIWGAAEARLARSDLEQRIGGPGLEVQRLVTASSVEVGGGYTVGFWQPGAHRELGDLRFETTIRGRYTHQNLDAFGYDDDPLSVQLGIGLVLRNRWGLFRFGFNVEEISGGG